MSWFRKPPSTRFFIAYLSVAVAASTVAQIIWGH